MEKWRNKWTGSPLLAQRETRLSLRSTRAESENLRDIALDAGIAKLILLPRCRRRWYRSGQRWNFSAAGSQLFWIWNQKDISSPSVHRLCHNFHTLIIFVWVSFMCDVSILLSEGNPKAIEISNKSYCTDRLQRGRKVPLKPTYYQYNLLSGPIYDVKIIFVIRFCHLLSSIALYQVAS